MDLSRIDAAERKPEMIQVQKTSPPLICPYCREALSLQIGVRCAGCDTAHHEICWAENDFHCSVFYCPGNQTLPAHSSSFYLWLERGLLILPTLIFLWLLFL